MAKWADFETHPVGAANRIEELEAKMKWADEISNIQAARLEELEAKLAKAVEALKPFAKAADMKLCGDWGDDESIKKTDTAFYIKFGYLRLARATLAAFNKDATKEGPQG